MHKRGSRCSKTERIGPAVCCCGLLILAGCSSQVKLVPVQGKLTLTDGKPVPGGHVVFVPIERDPNIPPSLPPEGMIGEGGSYMLFWNGQSGAPVGMYRVAFQPGMDRKAWSVVPAQYYSREKSPLEIEVVENKPEGGYDLKVQPQNGQGSANRPGAAPKPLRPPGWKEKARKNLP